MSVDLNIMILNDEHLNGMRLVGDEEADRVICASFEQKQEKFLYEVLRSGPSGIDQLPTGFLKEFVKTPAVLPHWYDESRLVNGQRFFTRFGLEIMTLLGALSLPYCYAASPGNKALYFTGKMRHTPGKRLHDTAHFIIEVMKEGSFLLSGNGSFEVQRTRLIHALVRFHVGRQPSWNSAWGIPVNQEDMAGTNLAFSHMVLRGLEKLNFVITEEDKEDFLYAWRFIGFQLRIDETLLPSSAAAARQLEDVIRRRHFKLSDEAKLLTQELLAHYKEAFPAPAGYLIESQIRYLVGPEVSILLGLQHHPIRDTLVYGLNGLQRRINKRFVNPRSYDIMMKNHLQQEKKYRAA